ncbi:hypothetical protein CL620_03535 [archaeon]|mgnify:CR=1 FL=1|nr:hypothetical protein [archaeon]|tara:strand:+ start:187 stop:402 length:216 start_codon:yes stop_codon:yes gene_type:complete
MKTNAILKTWGSSLGIVVPRSVIKAQHLKKGEEIIIEIRKKKTLREVFGSLKNMKIDSQKMKDESRREWEK